MSHVSVVTINSPGSDCALYLNNKYIHSACPGNGDSDASLLGVADGLAAALGGTVHHILVNAPDDWEWGDIESKLIASGKFAPSGA